MMNSSILATVTQTLSRAKQLCVDCTVFKSILVRSLRHHTSTSAHMTTSNHAGRTEKMLPPKRKAVLSAEEIERIAAAMSIISTDSEVYMTRTEALKAVATKINAEYHAQMNDRTVANAITAARTRNHAIKMQEIAGRSKSTSATAKSK
jgi:hypothetical protein